MTQEEINKAIKECCWLTDNMSSSAIKGICRGYCTPCIAVIDKCQCDTLKELFQKEKKK